MAKIVLLVSLAALVFCQGGPAVQAQRADVGAPRYVDRAQLMRDVATLSSPAFEGRQAGTAGVLKAREWLVQQFVSIGLAPARGSDFLQPFTFVRSARAVRPGGAPLRTEYPAANVLGRIAARDSRAGVMVITAHYDHLGVQNGVLFPGADDNASGVAALLAAARHFRIGLPPHHTIVFAALDAEESGLQGARALVGSDVLPRGRVRLNINLDMVARNEANEIYAAGPYHAAWEMPILQDVQTRTPVKILFGHDRPARQGGGLEDWTHSSDHGPFHDAGVPFVYFGVEDHPDYHKATDTADRIDPRFFGDVADMIIEAVRTFDARLP